MGGGAFLSSISSAGADLPPSASAGADLLHLKLGAVNTWL